MTPTESSISVVPASPIKGTEKRTFALPALIGLYSLLISVYAIIVGTQFVPASTRSDVEEAAIEAARSLAKVSVSSKRFGQMRLCDWSDSEINHGFGVNSLSATIRLTGVVAKQLKSERLSSLVRQDLKELKQTGKDLAYSLYRSIQPNYYSDLDGQRVSIYEQAYKMVARAQQGRTLVGLKLRLGRLDSSSLTSMMPAVRVPGESLPVDDGKYYLCNRDIPVPDAEPITFYELAAAPCLVDRQKFSPGNPTVISTVLLVEAIFESLDNSGRRKIVTHETSCAVVGAPPVKPSERCFMLSFPSGTLDRFSSLRNVLSCPSWDSKGEWHQAVEGNVPGEGHLAPPMGLANTDSNPSDAIAIAIYHWLTSCGPDIKPELLQQMFDATFASAPPDADSQIKTQAYANSAIVRDTGAARFTLLNQSTPQGLGQQVIAAAFSGGAAYPASALPMAVDQNGYCRIPGRSDCDDQLIRDFLIDLHKTNVAAIETKAVAETILKRVENAKQECDTRLSARAEEKRSLKKQEDIAAITEKIKQEEAARQKYMHIADLAVRASMHAKRAIEATYEIASDMYRYASLGLDRVDGERASYLLSRSLLFVPHLQALTDGDLYSTNAESHSTWLQEIFEVAETPDESMRVNGLPILQFWQTVQKPLSNGPTFVVFGSGEARSGGKGRLRVMNRTPYEKSGVGESQLLFFAPDAVKTGASPSVRWSLLLRDLAAFPQSVNGKPIQSPDSSWWTKDNYNGGVPSLCGEIQIRTPVPDIPDIPSGSSVQNPSLRESIPLVPPMPAELL